MTREDQIKFCQVCKNRKFNPQIGLICGLTNEKAQFTDTCESYDEDSELIKREKERAEVNPKKWKKSDDNFIDSYRARLVADFFEIDHRLNSINLVKKKYDYISVLSVIAYVFTLKYIITNDTKFLNNMKEPINLIFWVAILLYPIIRYFIPFHKYKLDKTGIELKKSSKVKWTDIKSVSLFEEVDEESSSSKQNIFLRLNSGKIEKLLLRNYSIENAKFYSRILKEKGYKMNEMDMIESLIMSFYNKYSHIN
ncbi:MAG: hypothetical protein KAT68_05455 [Bacteroidales bacterium]|nr:hypothetical protein [Bacteroidales bacterium]